MRMLTACILMHAAILSFWLIPLAGYCQDLPVMGYKKPADAAEVFAPGFISSNKHEFSCTFSPDMKEFYFTRGKDIWYTFHTDTGWTDVAPVSFCSEYLDNEPFITHDNKYLFFGSRRPHGGNGHSVKYGTWVVERKNDEWVNPRFAGEVAFVSSAKNGNIYTRSIYPEYRAGKIVKTRFDGQNFVEMVIQEGGVEMPGKGYLQGMHPAISIDETYMVFDAMYESWGNSPQLFISYKTASNEWSPALNLSSVLGVEGGYAPYISPDGELLFFSLNGDIYWVKTRVINRLKKSEKDDEQGIQKINNTNP